MLEPDHHRWNAQVGDQIVKSSVSVWEVLASEWCKSCMAAQDRTSLAQAVMSVGGCIGGGALC